MISLSLAFTAPYVLLALAALPVIWLLLRVIPPQPRRIAFPPLRIFADLISRQETPARTPWWLLLLRLLAIACLIFACAGPMWNPPQSLPGKGPVLLLVDNGFTAARSWQSRTAYMEETANEAFRAGRPFAITAFAEAPSAIETKGPAPTRDALRNLKPAPHLADRSVHVSAIRAFLETHPDSSLIWLSDGVKGAEDAPFPEQIKAVAENQSVVVVQEKRPDILALTPSKETGLKLTIRAVRADASGRDGGLASARDDKGQPVAEVPFRFASGSLETEISFDIPTELRNSVTRVEVLGEKSAGAVVLLDERNRRRSVGIVSGTTLDQSQPFLAPTYYLQRALQPYADIRQSIEKDGGSETISALLDQHVNVLILADTGTLDKATAEKLTAYVDGGGLLIRFAGNRLTSGDAPLLPVTLRRGDRDLGGVLSWSQPKKLAGFSRNSPFYGLSVPNEVVINRQVLAEPDTTLDERTWATLEDGTPLVTAARHGKGTIVLFHVTATPAWSNLPLSGLFVDMLRRTIRFGQVSAADSHASGGKPLAPRLLLDGYGDFHPPTPTVSAVKQDYAERAVAAVPPGFYGPADSGIAVNALTAADTVQPLDLSSLSVDARGLTRAGAMDLRMPLFLAALILFLIDSLLMLLLSGGLSPRILRNRGGTAAMLLLAATLLVPASGRHAGAQTSSGQQENIEQAALATHLAFVITGDSEIDAASKTGLAGLGQFLRLNTSFEPASPTAIDPEKDELAFYPLIYWPISPAQPFPSDAAIRNLNTFMRNGGTILFDTRDAFRNRPGMGGTPETAYLRRLLASLDVPQLEPVPADHVLTKSFYLLEAFPGRYDSSPLWTEISNPDPDDGERGPVRRGDGVSPVLVTGNDFAAAWAIGARNETLYPVTGSDPRQREMAYRSGVNIVLYTLTGNYKADQVHVEDILKRLGRSEGK